MTLDARGIYQYDETDDEATFSDLLNLGMRSVSDRFAKGDALTTGWRQVTPSPAGVDAKYRLNNGMVEVLWETANSIPTGFVTIAPAGAIPADLDGIRIRPPANRFGVGYLSGYMAGTYITPGGAISVNNTTGAARGTSNTGQILYTP